MEYTAIIVVWGLILFGFAIAELVKLNGNLFHFAIGAAGALVCYALGQDLIIQVVAFAVLTGLSFLLLRPLVQRFAARNATVHEEGLDLLVGLEGKVISKIDVSADSGRIDINGRPVKAVPVDPQQKYNVGDRVVVTGLDGDKLVVRKAKRRK